MISSINCHSSKILEYVDCHLQLIVQEIPSYINDVSDFLRKLKPITEVPKNTYLVTLDVKSLYTSILNYEGIKAVKISNGNFTRKTITTKVISTYLALIITFFRTILYSIQNTFYESMVVQWELSVHHITQIYS